jgi:hypothetical protein
MWRIIGYFVRQFAAAASAAEHAHGSGGDGRLTFQLHGQKGPHSYRFGFDTGKGYTIIYINSLYI